MSGSLIETTPAHEPLRRFIDSELRRVEAIFSAQLESGLPAVNRLCEHIERYRGKMLRPTLTLLSGLAAASGAATTTTSATARTGGDGQLTRAPGRADHRAAGASFATLNHAHHVIAAVCEMIHMATLVHDDVLDDAEMRRQASTINYLRGNEAAVLLGDYLISNAFHLCSTLDRPEINRRIGEVTNTLCAGELLQLHHRERWSIDESTYMEIINRKTASLIGVCCELGAAASNADDNTRAAFRNFGSKVGVAFQIQDDLLDFVGDESQVGKTLGRDLDKGKLTLPFILYFSEAPPRMRERMLRWLGAGAIDEDRPAEVTRLLAESGAVDRARQHAAALIADAKERLMPLPDSPALRMLFDLADAVITRNR